MKKDKKTRIAVITSNLNIEYTAEIRRGIMQEAAERSYDVYLFNTYVESDETKKYNLGQYNIYALTDFTLFDAVIVYTNLILDNNVYHDLDLRLQKAGVPVVGIDAPLGDSYCIGTENYQSMKNIVEHLICHHGLKKIAYISGPQFNPDSQVRLRAYCDALRENGIPFDESLIFHGAFLASHGRKAAQELLYAGGKLPQAAVCADDAIALGFCAAMEEAGVRVPEQIAVTGFDNMFEARNAVPRITTVERQLEDLGRAAVQKIADCLQNIPTPQNETFPTMPIFADSCGCTYDRTRDVEDVRCKYMELMDVYEKHLSESNRMIEKLNDSKSLDDLLQRLKPFVENTGCDKFYLCLDRDLVDELQRDSCSEGELLSDTRKKGYGKTMAVAMAYEYGGYVSYDDFPTNSLLPYSRPNEERENHTYLFAPVHFRDISQGYVIVENSDFALTSPLFRNWVNNLSSGLENLRKQHNLSLVKERLEYLYVTDSLTGLYNRFGFRKYAEEQFQRCVNEQKAMMILFADLDGLKQINDTYGHDSGDAAIAEVAKALRKSYGPECICARFGGDEFIVVLPGATEREMEIYNNYFQQELTKVNGWHMYPFTIDASTGCQIFYPKEDDDLNRFIEVVDQKMYLQKNGKKDAGK